MKKKLKHDITELQKRVQQLSQAMMQNGKTLDERNRLESELRVAQQAKPAMTVTWGCGLITKCCGSIRAARRGYSSMTQYRQQTIVIWNWPT